MNILYIAHRIPYPPNKGEKIRAFHQIRFLSRNHRVHLACMVDDREDLKYMEVLKKYCVSVDAVYRSKTLAKFQALLGLFRKQPLTMSAFYSGELQDKITQKLRSEKIDRILVFSSVMAEYVWRALGIPRIVDFVDVDSAKWQLFSERSYFPFSWIYRIEASRLARYEEKVTRTFDHSIIVSDKEAELFKSRVNGQPLSVIPNGVDLDYFSPKLNEIMESKQSILIFTGMMDYFPNIEAVQFFCDSIFPTITKVLPQVQFYIVGRNPTWQVRRLSNRPQVIVTSSVPDVRPYLAKATVSVAPFRTSRGVQNKVLEALAMGLPVVGTSLAFQGMKTTVSDGIRIADDPEKFGREVLSLLTDSDLQRQCSIQARKYVEQYHQWQDHAACLETLLQKACLGSQ
jgi:sugar transferase (PEP-CTERM/EpsH1 system associated)